ncbi:unnamed protein product [Brassica oleracea]
MFQHPTIDDEPQVLSGGGDEFAASRHQAACQSQCEKFLCLCLTGSVADFSFYGGDCSELSSVGVLISVMGLDRRGLIRVRSNRIRKLCGSWSDSSCRVVKLWVLVTSRDGIIWQAIGGSDRSGLRRLGVLGSSSGWYRVAAVGSSDMSSSLLIAI